MSLEEYFSKNIINNLIFSFLFKKDKLVSIFYARKFQGNLFLNSLLIFMRLIFAGRNLK